MVILGLIFLHILFIEGINCYRFEPSTLTLKNLSGCPEDEKNPVHFTHNIKQISRNKFAIDGNITIKVKINGPISVILFISSSLRTKNFIHLNLFLCIF